MLLVFSSCATVPFDDAAARNFFAPESSQSVETVIPRWQAVRAASVGGGGLAAVSLFAGKMVSPRLEFWALRVDLASPFVRVVTAGGGGERNPNGSFPAVKVSSFVRSGGLLAGINALPFDKVSAVEGEERLNAGLVISDGRLLSPPHASFDALVFYADGGAAVVSQSDVQAADGVERIEQAAGGFRQVLRDGVLTEYAGVGTRHPRSAAGVSADGKILYLLVIDGRRLASAGGTLAETALLLERLGACNGINFDGGGSTALALRFSDGVVRVVNTPVHGFWQGRERAVAGCLGIALK